MLLLDSGICTAACYDWFTAAAFLGRRPAVYRRLALDAGIGIGDRVLDLGSGPGTLARAAAELVGSYGTVIGLDRSPEMVIYAQRRGGDNRVGDVTRPPFADQSFDVVVSALALHHVELDNRDAVFTEAFRMLTPGGRMLVAEFVPPCGSLGKAVARGVFSEEIADDPRADLVDRMTRAGFRRIETRGSGVLTVVRGVRPIGRSQQRLPQ